MADDAYRRTLNRTRLVAALLEAGGILVGVGALIWALNQFWTISQDDNPTVSAFLAATALLLAAVAGGLLLWGIAELLRKLDQRGPGQRAGMSDLAAELASNGSGDAENAQMSEVIALLREVRDISLLNEQQRTLRLDAQAREVSRKLAEEVPALLREHNWIEARRRVQLARERFPQVASWDTFEQQIEQMRAGVEARDIESARRQIDDLAALGAWPRAMDVIRDLLHRHPNSAKANELARWVRVEHDKLEAEARSRLMAQCQEAARARDWNTAVACAHELIEAYPTSPESQALKMDLPTLQSNAEVQIRQQLEAEYRELVHQHRYYEALRLAQTVVANYPNSPQARALAEQIPRLEERVSTGR